MSGGDSVGTLILSIDLELDLDHYEIPLQRRLDEVRKQLIELSRAANIPATWAVADPMLSAASESILAANCGHEIAVLGDQAWLGPGCGRERLARELTRRFSVPRKAGISVSTLALRNVKQVVDLDLLIDHGITALCTPPVEHPSISNRIGPPPTRFGLWQPPLAWRLPPRKSWWSPAGWLIRGEIKRAIRRRTLVHLQLGALQIVDAPDSALGSISAMFHYIAAKRDAGQLTIETIGQLASRALDCRTAMPSRSILRPAA
jgi:hypothetical protein